jgi:peptide/nickel transport system substrate-binding protein
MTLVSRLFRDASVVRGAIVPAMASLALALGVAGCATHRSHDDGVLRLLAAQDPATLDPLVTDNAEVQDVAALIHGYLVKANDRGDFFPDLVLRVPTVANGGIGDGGRTIRYELRRGVRWHDGAPFDARDVVFSFRAAMNPRNDVPDRSGFDDIASVTAPNPYEVVVRLRRAYSPAIATFFSAGANDIYPILPAHLLASLPDLNTADYGAHPVGLGPYRLVSWDRGSRLILEADPHFRRGKPHIARIEMSVIPDANTALTVWQSGGLDFFPVRGFGGSRSRLAGARAVAGAREYASDHYQFDYVMFNTSRGPLRDPKVREALVRGIDRDRIERDVRGELHRAGDGDRLPGQFAYDPTIREAPYDPAGAARLLDMAGWRLHDGVRERGGVPLSLDIVGPASSPGSERFNLQMQADLTSLGIRSQIKAYQYNTLFAPAGDGGIYANGRFDLTLYGWQPGEDADHSYLYRCDTRPPNGENYGRICDPIIDRAAADELAAVSPDDAARADRAILRELDAKSDLLFLGFDREFLFARASLKGIEPSVLGQHFWNIETWSWK